MEGKEQRKEYWLRGDTEHRSLLTLRAFGECMLPCGSYLYPMSTTVYFLPSPVFAGFPSPAEDYLEAPINIHDYLVTNQPATFLGRVSGNSMCSAGIHNGDIIVVDRSLSPQPDQVVIISNETGFMVKFFRSENTNTFLASADGDKITLNESISLWGVVTAVVRRLL